jgi:hypothetical protein
MNPLIQLKKATPLFVITLVLACFALSPQAFAAATPTFTPNQWCGCKHYKNVTISSGTSGGGIFVKIDGQVGGWISNPGIWPAGYLGKKTLQAAHTSNTPAPNHTPTIDSGWGQSGTYKYCWYCSKVVLVIGGILLAAVLIWLFVKRSSASR